MKANGKNQTQTDHLQLAFDIGHSSIGWAVFGKSSDATLSIEVLGCGAVTFRADDCLASKRRDYRRQRRHIRSTRQRIKRMKELFLHLGVLSEKELNKPGCAWPWQLAARVPSSKTGENPATYLSWPELWDVLRWYAHNRGYDGNRRWSNGYVESDEDTEKVGNARSLLSQHGTNSMAETFCAVLGIDPLGKRKASRVRFKDLNAAFPREIVENEVRRILRSHFGTLKGVDALLEKALFEDWRALPSAAIKLPKRYSGGLLFGQLVPRFDNRIISRCPITGEKVPLRDCPEFLNFRWAMQLANIRVGEAGPAELRPLNSAERGRIDAAMRRRGYLTVKELKEAVRRETRCERDNLDTMLMHPDAKEALLVDPVQKLQTCDCLKAVWPLLPERLQKRVRGKWRNGKSVSLREIHADLVKLGSTTAFDSELQRQIDAANTRTKAKKEQLTRERLLEETFALPPISGRAPYARALLAQAYREVMQGKHPKEAGGCLFITDEIRARQMNRSLCEQTNNHLVRHRLLILERLLGDIVKEYASGDRNRVARITVEVNRDLREMSGKTAKEKAQELGLRVANHHSVAAKLEKTLAGRIINGRPVEITAGLIRKARVADDLGWTCPYTGQKFEPIDLVTKNIDRDHIVPRSERASDSLDSLALTYASVNKWKGKRTAWQFVQDEQGKPVPDQPTLTILSLSRFKEFVEKLETYKGHDDDKRRKKKRKDLLLLPSYAEKEFTPRDLTQTSQLVRLAAQVLKRNFADCQQQPIIISLPGSVTGSVRKAWKVLGCLSLANPQVLDADGEVKSKSEIRDITHLHHALDACVLGLAAHYIPNNGRVWQLILKRNPNENEKRELLELGVFGFNAEGRFELRDLDRRLKEQIRQRLAEKRVVQHIPARMDGLRVEQNTWRVMSVKDGEARIEQAMRGPDGKRVVKMTEEKVTKLLGVNPQGEGKLQKLKGALVIPDNYGVVLDPKPAVVPFHKVWNRLTEARTENGRKWPRVLRNGQLLQVPSGNFKGTWRVFSAKNNASGLALDIGAPDVVRLKNKTEGHKINVLLSSLLKSGMIVSRTPLTGLPCPTTSSA